MTDRLERALADHADEVFGGADGPHLDDEVLERAGGGQATLTEAQRAHLADCAECRWVLALASEGAEVVPLPARGPRWGAVVALAAAVALGVALWPRTAATPEGGLTARGDEAPLTAEVVFLATDPSGRRRELRDDDAVPVGARLGFVYGNPGGVHATLTVLGWDGERLHRYYPEVGEAPFAVDRGPQALGRRLPYDIELREAHGPGPLTVAAAFDVDPEALAAALEAGALPKGASVVRLRLTEGAP